MEAWRRTSSGDVRKFFFFILVVCSIAKSIIHWVILASGLWLILWTLPLWGSIWIKDGHPYKKWMTVLTAYKASWVFGIVLGLAIGSSDLAQYMRLLNETISIAAIWLFLDCFCGYVAEFDGDGDDFACHLPQCFQVSLANIHGCFGCIKLEPLWSAIPAFH